MTTFNFSKSSQDDEISKKIDNLIDQQENEKLQKFRRVMSKYPPEVQEAIGRKLKEMDKKKN